MHMHRCAHEADAGGRLLLHLAAQCRASAAIVEGISSLHPEAVRQQDHNSKLPLHYALEHKPPNIGAVEVLLRVYPAGASVAVGFGDQQFRPG